MFEPFKAAPAEAHLPLRFTRVTSPENADANALIVTLFRCESGIIRGWYLGPIAPLGMGGAVPYAAPSLKLFAMVALVHARRIAHRRRLPVYVVDPEELWDAMLRGR